MTGNAFLPFDDALICREVPAGCWFVDNDVFMNSRDAMARLAPTRPLISAITYCESIQRIIDANARANVDTRLRLYGTRVVPFDEMDAAHFAMLLHQALEALRAEGLGRQQRAEAKKRINRARNDLMVAATATRHGGQVMTGNHRDFGLLPTTWTDVATFLAS